MHSIGIGNGVSEHLIKECANKGKGSYILVMEKKSSDSNYWLIYFKV